VIVSQLARLLVAERDVTVEGYDSGTCGALLQPCSDNGSKPVRRRFPKGSKIPPRLKDAPKETLDSIDLRR
jgi:hypothetical protein